MPLLYHNVASRSKQPKVYEGLPLLTLKRKGCWRVFRAYAFLLPVRLSCLYVFIVCYLKYYTLGASPLPLLGETCLSLLEN